LKIEINLQVFYIVGVWCAEINRSNEHVLYVTASDFVVWNGLKALLFFAKFTFSFFFNFVAYSEIEESYAGKK